MKRYIRVFVFSLFGLFAVLVAYGQEPESRIDTTRQSREEIQEMYLTYASIVASKHEQEKKEYTARTLIMPVLLDQPFVDG